jgi:hypothetical protein
MKKKGRSHTLTLMLEMRKKKLSKELNKRRSEYFRLEAMKRTKIMSNIWKMIAERSMMKRKNKLNPKVISY